MFVALTAAALTGYLGGSVAEAMPGSGRTAIVALGDSFISGEGGALDGQRLGTVWDEVRNRPRRL